MQFVPYEDVVRTNIARFAAIRQHGARMRVLRTIALTMLAVTLGGATAAFGWFKHLSGAMNNKDVINDDLTSALSSDPNAKAGDPFYMLILGVDRSEERKGEASYGESDSNYRSDSMMVARIAPKDKKVTLVSLHRDTAIDFGKEKGVMKLNACYAMGGAPLAVKTVSEFADVPIQHYAEIDFDGLTEIVDALGGVEVDVPMDIKDPDYTGANFKKGKQTVNGEEALQLCRARHAFDQIGDGDLYRAANQRMVLSAIAKKALASDPATLASTVTALARCVRTDLSVENIVSLLLNFQGINPETDIMSGFEPTESAYVNATWFETCDKEAWQLMMTRVGLGLSPWSDKKQDETQGRAGMTDLIVNGDTDDEDIKITSKAGKNALSEEELIEYFGGSSAKSSKNSSYYDDDTESERRPAPQVTYDDYDSDQSYDTGSDYYDGASSEPAYSEPQESAPVEVAPSHEENTPAPEPEPAPAPEPEPTPAEPEQSEPIELSNDTDKAA